MSALCYRHALQHHGAVCPECAKEQSDAYNKAITALIRDRGLAVEGLTMEQMAKAIRQMIDCGDFHRYVRVSCGGQCVTYIPFSETENLHVKLDQVRVLLKRCLLEFEQHLNTDETRAIRREVAELEPKL